MALNRKTGFIIFIAIIFLIANIQLLNAKVNTSNGSNNQGKTKNDTTSTNKNNNGLAKGKNKNSVPDTDSIIITPLPEPPPIVNLDVYQDNSCTLQYASIIWGEVTPGESKTITLYIKNNGEVDTLASLITENWHPKSCKKYISLTWDYNGREIIPEEIVPVKLILSISPECPISDAFNFDIVVIGT